MTMAAGSNKGKTTKMICPDCGGEMNFHAEKVNQSVRAGRKSDLSAEFGESGEVVEEIHACPGCGAIGTRRAD